MLTRRTFLIAPIALAACKGSAADILQLSGTTMGTTYNIVAVDHEKAVSKADLNASVSQALAEVNAQMSNWDPTSELSRFNTSTSTEPQPVSPALREVMAAAQDVHAASDGQFDVALGPLIELWGFGARGATRAAPSDGEVIDALALTGHGAPVEVGADTLRKTHPDTQVYLAAIGKGYGVDRVAGVMERFGIGDYMVEIGGDLYTSGRNPDGLAWQIGVETPDAFDRSIQQVVGVSNRGMATSGDYRNYFEEDGVRYSHLLDARTGRPVTHTTASATVLAENAMLADAWATAMLTLGRERGLEIAEAQNLAVLFVERDGTISDVRFKATQSSAFAALQA
ncbi:MAG: FAD:protein FMN transferase [Dinoroseobacter sp.]|nr:FAD:protein FMN transferase [Dinoroseobacter sp.]